MQLQARRKGLEFGAVLPDAPLVFNTDRRALSQIVINLTSNAIKFTDRGNVRLVLEEGEQDARRVVRIVVHDTGTRGWRRRLLARPRPDPPDAPRRRRRRCPCRSGASAPRCGTPPVCHRRKR